VTLTHVPTGDILAEEVVWATTMWSRARGLIGGTLPSGRALVIEPTKQIHTFFMTFPIDVVFCDSGWTCLHVISNMQPWKVSRWVRGARAVIELPAGAAARVQAGERLEIQSPRER
jgi:uncharacterized protein